MILITAFFVMTLFLQAGKSVAQLELSYINITAAHFLHLAKILKKLDIWLGKFNFGFIKLDFWIYSIFSKDQILMDKIKAITIANVAPFRDWLFFLNWNW